MHLFTENEAVHYPSGCIRPLPACCQFIGILPQSRNECGPHSIMEIKCSHELRKQFMIKYTEKYKYSEKKNENILKEENYTLKTNTF